MAGDTGNGATVTRSGFSGDIISISFGNQTLEALDKSTLGDSTFMKKLAASLADAGAVTLEILSDAAVALPALGGAGITTTFTWPLQTGETTAANIAGTAFVTDRKYPDFQNNVVQNSSITFTWDGETGPTFTAST